MKAPSTLSSSATHPTCDMSSDIKAVNGSSVPMSETDYWSWLDQTKPETINTLRTKTQYLAERFGFVRGTHRMDTDTLSVLKCVESYWATERLGRSDA